MNIQELNKCLLEMLTFGNMTQCVAKIKDIGNDTEIIDIVADNTDYRDEQEMEQDYQDNWSEEDPSISLMLAYHKGDAWDKTEPLYDEEGEPIPFEYNSLKESADLYVAPQLYSDLKELIAEFNDNLKFFSGDDRNEPGISNMISIAEDILAKLKLYQSQEDIML